MEAGFAGPDDNMDVEGEEESGTTVLSNEDGGGDIGKPGGVGSR